MTSSSSSSDTMLDDDEEEAFGGGMSFLRPLAVRATSLAEEARVVLLEDVMPILVREFTQWKNGLWRELEVYESRGHTRTRLVLTCLIVFVIAFHLELIRMWQHFVQKGGQFDQLRFQWTLYYQSKQRQWRRNNKLKLKQKRAAATLNTTSLNSWINKQPSTNPAKNLASPTSTASTVEAESSLGISGGRGRAGAAGGGRGGRRGRSVSPIPPASGHRGNLMLMMKNHHRALSPRPRDSTPEVLRDAYGLKIGVQPAQPAANSRQNGWQTNYNSQSMKLQGSSSSLLRSSHSHRSQSMGHAGSGSQRSLSNTSTHSTASNNRRSYNSSYRLNNAGIQNGSSNSRLLGQSTNTFADSQQSFELLTPPPTTTNIATAKNGSSITQNLSSSTLGSSKDTRSTHNTPSRTPSEPSYASPTDHSGSTNRSPMMSSSKIKSSSRSTTSSSTRKQRRRNTSPPRKTGRQAGEGSIESTPSNIRRTQTVDSPARTNNSNSTGTSTTTATKNSKRRIKNKAVGTSGVPLAQARRRMSGVAATTPPGAAGAGGGGGAGGIQRTRTNGSSSSRLNAGADERVGFARQMHPRSRSGNGAMCSTASQMYMARQPSQAARGNANANANNNNNEGAGGARQQQLHPRSRSGHGAVSPTHQPRQMHPRSRSGHGATSPPPPQPRTPNRTTSAGNRTLSPVRSQTSYRAGQGPGARLTRELSRQELGYE